MAVMTAAMPAPPVALTAAERPPGARVLAVTSGKGGVGKTFVSANLAAALARRGQRVLVLDADLGLANLDVVLNLQPRTTLHDVLNGHATWRDAAVAAPGGFSVILAGSGLVEYAHLTPAVRERFQALMQQVRPLFDVVLLDTGAGLADVVLFALDQADEVLLVTTPEPTALTDAYAMLKVLATEQDRRKARLVVNQVTEAGQGPGIVRQLQSVLQRFVPQAPIQLLAAGDVPQDSAVKQAVMRRRLMLVHQPDTPAALAMLALADGLLDTVLAPTA